jgi:glycosyltransferase involved in cell wall biosynthesis
MGQFARMLPDVGWNVTVLTARHSATTSIDRTEADQIAARASVIEAWSPTSTVSRRGKPVARVGLRGAVRSAARFVSRSVLFPDREALWIPSALRAGRRALAQERHDVVFASYGPASNLVIGWQLARERRIPLVIDFRDLWATLPVETAFVSQVHRALAFRTEERILRSASRITAVAPRMAASLAEVHQIAPEKAVSITNGFDPSDVERVRDQRGPEPRPFRLMYAGSVHADYDLSPFWKALKLLAADRTITPETFRVEFVGNLDQAEPRAHGVDAFVETTPFVPRARLFDELARADALLVVETPGYYAQFSYAAKVFDYLLTGKPVVAIVDAGGNTATLLTQARVGFCAEDRDPVSVRRAIERVLGRKGAPPRDVHPDEEPLRKFSRQYLVTQLATVFDDVVRTEPRGRWVD